MSECSHDIVAQDVAVNADGMCPLCLAADNKKLRKALETIINEKGDYWYDKMIRVAKEALKG